MKKTLLALIPVAAVIGLGGFYYTTLDKLVDDGTYMNDVNISYQNVEDVDKIIVQIFANTKANKKIRIIYNNDYFVLDNGLFSIDLESTKLSFYEGTKNKIFINTNKDELYSDISSYFSIDLSGIDTYRLAKDIENDFFSMNVNSNYNLDDYIKENIYKESYEKKASITIKPENADLLYQATGSKIVINGKSRFSTLEYFEPFKEQLTSNDLSLFASALNSLVIRTDTSSFIKTNTYLSDKKVVNQLKPHMVYVSYASDNDDSFYNDLEDSIIINVTRPSTSTIGLELFLKDSQEFSNIQVTNKSVRFEQVYGSGSGYSHIENGVVYFVSKEQKVDDEIVLEHVYDTYYLPVGVKSNE